MNIYKVRKDRKLTYIIILLIMYMCILYLFPFDLNTKIILYILFAGLGIQVFYSWHLITDIKGLHVRFKIISKIQQKSYLWIDIGRIKYKSKKVYLYDKSNKKILILGSHLTNHTQLWKEIYESIQTYNKECILEGSFIKLINDIKIKD